MNKEHPNLALLSKLDILDLDASAPLFSEKFVWHFFNPKLPDVQGDYEGVEGLKKFFERLAERTNGTFKVSAVSAMPIGEELVVVHVRDTMELDGDSLSVDAAVVWRIVGGQLAEAWDIPAVFHLAE